MAELERLTTVNEQTLADVNVLLRQLSERIPPCTVDLLKRLIESPYLELWVVKDRYAIVGMGELAITLKPEGVIAQVEDVVVREDRRGKGYGKLISEKLIERAKAHEARVIQLSSNAKRVEANGLYQKLGFKQWDTNMYQMKL